MQFKAQITHNLDELVAAQTTTAQAAQAVVDAANAAIESKMSDFNDALAAEDAVTLSFGVVFSKVADEVAPAADAPVLGATIAQEEATA